MASIVLSASTYTVIGRISIVVKVGTTTVGACTAYVYRTTTDTIVDPGSVIPDISELLALIGECEAATAAASTADNLLRSGHPDAEVMCGRTVTDAYMGLTRKDPPEWWEELEKLVGDFMRKRISDLRKITHEDWKKVMRASVREAKGSGYLNPDRPVFGEWLKEMREKYV